MDDETDGVAAGCEPLELLHEAVCAMLAELPEEDRRFAASAAEMGDQPTAFPEDDGSVRVEFAGRVLGYVRLSEA